MPDRFDDAPEFDGSNNGTGQQGSKKKMISGADEGHVVSRYMKLL